MKQKEFVLQKHHHPTLSVIEGDDAEFCSFAFFKVWVCFLATHIVHEKFQYTVGFLFF